MSPLAAAAQPDYWARGLAGASLLLTLAGFALAFVAYRRNGARVMVRVGARVRWWQIFRIPQGAWLEVRVINRGLAPIQVTGAGWLIERRQRGHTSKAGRHGVDSVMPGEPTVSPFPLTVDGLHSGSWKTFPPPLADPGAPTASRMRLRVALGSGGWVHSPWIVIHHGWPVPGFRRIVGWRRMR